MKNDELTKQQAEAVLKALNNAIEQGPWEESNFLKAIGKNLCSIRDSFVLQSDSSGKDSSATRAYANQIARRHGQQKVYIQIYSSDGMNMHSWEWIVANLPRQMISRPIYADEEDVKAIIKTKENKFNEAYVAFYIIGENDILQVNADKVPIDKLGKPRLFLKDGTLKLVNVDYFVHASGIYHYSQGRLIKE